MNELNEIGKAFNVFDKQSKDFVDNHKHLANTLIEIPKETVGKWMADAQRGSMLNYNRVESAYVELYLELKTDTFRIIERNKNTQALTVKEYSDIIDSQDKTIKMIEKQRDLYQKMLVELKEDLEDLKSQRTNKEIDFREVVRENERLLTKIQNLNAPKQ